MTQLPPDRRRWQFAPLTLLVVAGICAVLAIWLAVTIWNARKQRAAAVEIAALGGKVVWQGELSRDRSHMPVLEIDLKGTRVTDAGLELIGSFDQPIDLDLSDTPITDDGLARLGGLIQLQSLKLAGTRITDAGLEHLAGLKNLVDLDLARTGVTAEGVIKLRRALPKCYIHQ